MRTDVVCVPGNFFFRCRSFSPWWPIAFFIFAPLLSNFHVFQFQWNWSPWFFHSRSSSLKSSRKKESALLLLYFFSLKVRVAMRLTAETREKRNDNALLQQNFIIKWRNDRRSERNLCNCIKKEAWKKIQTFNGVWTRDLAIYRCDALPTELWIHSSVGRASHR